MAAATSSISVAEKRPILLINLCVSTPRNWRVSIAETFLSPLLESGIMLICQMLCLKQSCQSVIGAINFIGRMPTASEFTTTAGRFFLIYAPIVGSKLTSQTSPRLGKCLILNYVPALQLLSIRILPVICYHLFCLFCHYSTTFLQ